MRRGGRIATNLSCAPVAPACQYTGAAGEPTLTLEYTVLLGRRVGVGIRRLSLEFSHVEASCHYPPWCSGQHWQFLIDTDLAGRTSSEARRFSGAIGRSGRSLDLARRDGRLIPRRNLVLPVDVIERTGGDRTRTSQEVRRSEGLQVVFVTPEEVSSRETPTCWLYSRLLSVQPDGAQPTPLQGHEHEAAAFLGE